MCRCCLFIALMAYMLLPTFAQQPKVTPTPQQQPSQDEDVVRVNVRLVQVDATVTDKNGREVKDLKQEDFEIFANGRPQQITNFSYNPAIPAKTPAPTTAKTDSVAQNAPAPSVPLRPGNATRTMALVVDDLGLTSVSMIDVKNALKKFVEEEMQPGDLVAILRTSGGMGFLQQFTSDKRLLYAAVERMRWNPAGRAGVLATPSWATKEFEAAMRETHLEDADPIQQRKIFYTLGTIGALKYIVRGLAEMPGRKALIFFSDGIQLFTVKDGEEDPLSSTDRRWNVLDSRVRDAALDLTKETNSASVVIHTIEARGPQTMGGKVEDIENPLNSQEFYEDQEGLGFLADETGGVFAQDSDLNRAMTRVLDEQNGYYLIGFKPDDTWFKPEADGKSKPKIEVKLKRSDLRVRYRKGFYGNFDKKAKPAPSTPGQKLFAAFMSPFSASDIGLKLTSLFGHDKQEGSFVRSLLYIDASGLTFNEEADGQHKATVNLTAVTFGENGRMIDEVDKTFAIRAAKGELEGIKRGGFVYEMTVPIKKAGPYQLRVAVMDAASERVGSASQFIEVPNISKNHLTLSDILISGKDKAPSVRQAAVQNSVEKQSRRIDLQATTAVRKFKRGMELDYLFIVLNAQFGRGANRPQLEKQVILYRDGKPVYTGPVKPLELGQQTEFNHILAPGVINLGTDLGPGEYVLQVIVTDKLAKEKKYQTATRWIDFDIVE